MQNISGFGLQISLIASTTYPKGILLTQFADDADALDFPTLQIADKAMGLNGDLIIWSKPQPIIVNMNVIAGSFNDLEVSTLYEANRTGKGKTSARDIISMSIVYPGLSIPLILSNGAITDGIPATSVASSSRFKTKSYAFAFENKIGGIGLS
jgi:hypothetical protein